MNLGGSYSGNTAVSKTAYVGSIPTAPAKSCAVGLAGRQNRIRARPPPAEVRPCPQ